MNVAGLKDVLLRSARLGGRRAAGLTRLIKGEADAPNPPPTEPAPTVSAPEQLVRNAIGDQAFDAAKDLIDPKRLETFSAQRPEAPGHADIFIRDVLGGFEPAKDDREHLEAAFAWLLRSQAASGTGGFAAGYSFAHGWLPPYPETTGYIIQSLWRGADVLQRTDLRAAAVAAADWEIDIQFESGAVQAGYYGKDPSSTMWKGELIPASFNTGQVVLGWIDTYERLKDQRYLGAARKATAFLETCVDAEGVFRGALSPSPTNPERAYYTRVAWSMIATGLIYNRDDWVSAGQRHLDWVISKQRPNGWVEGAQFHLNEQPLTHNLAYVAEGLLGGGLLLSEPRYLDASIKLATGAMEACEKRGFLLVGTYDENWRSSDKYSCLTGNAQFAGLWLTHGMRVGDLRLVNAGLKMVDWLKGVHSLDSPNPGIKGGIAGAWPIDGGYSLYNYLNWPTKFFTDALMDAMAAKAWLEGR